jgi:hypothetical protein
LNASLPLRAPLDLVSRITAVLVGLLAVAAATGLALGPRGWYDPDPATQPAFLGQDVATLVLGLPLLFWSSRAARAGSVRGLVCWAGALFYVAYSYYFFVIGGRFSPLFPVYLTLVSLGTYGALAVVFSIDHEQLARRFDRATPVRLVSGYLGATSVLFAGLWLAMIGSALARGVALTGVQRAVIAVDAIVLLPLLFYAGVALWRRAPIGYALAGLLLVKAAATFLTLLISTAFIGLGGGPVSVGETAAYAAGLAGAVGAAALYFRHVIVTPRPPGSRCGRKSSSSITPAGRPPAGTAWWSARTAPAPSSFPHAPGRRG